MDLRSYVRTIPDFPIPGILFRDITPMLADAGALRESVQQLVRAVDGQAVDKVIGIESRGFIFGTPLATEIDAGFVPMRKPGKLPFTKLSRSYLLEYGEATLELHTDAIEKGDRVVIVDDLLATGGTARAAAELVEEAGGEIVSLLFVIELLGLDGRAALGDRRVEVLMPMGADGD